MGTMTRAASASHPDEDPLSLRVAELERLVGKDGSTIHGTDSTGLHRAIGKLTVSVDKMTEAYEASVRAAATAGSVAARLGWRAADVLLAAGVIGLIGWLAGFHR